MPELVHLSMIIGKRHIDSRGILTFFSEFDLTCIRRLYIIEHPDINIVRAWQGHRKEQKWFSVLAGSFKIVLVKPDNWEKPSENLNYDEFHLFTGLDQVLHVPGGYANGIKALEPNSRLMVFSDFSVEESLSDGFRFEKNKWYKW